MFCLAVSKAGGSIIVSSSRASMTFLFSAPYFTAIGVNYMIITVVIVSISNTTTPKYFLESISISKQSSILNDLEWHCLSKFVENFARSFGRNHNLVSHPKWRYFFWNLSIFLENINYSQKVWKNLLIRICSHTSNCQTNNWPHWDWTPISV